MSFLFLKKSAGNVYCAGDNSKGQLGLGVGAVGTNRVEVTRVNITDVKQVICGGKHTFIIKTDGTVWSCGFNDKGQLGLGDTTDRTTFTQVNITDVKQIICGYSNTFAIKTDGTVWSCGWNGYGQLGLGDITDRTTFTQINITDVKQFICGGGSHEFIIKTDGTVWSCGFNNNGQLGLGDSGTGKDRTTFTQVNITDVKQIICGDSHTFIIKTDGTVWATGYNSFGQLGLGDTTKRTTFEKLNIPEISDIEFIYLKWHTSTIVTQKGKIYECGSGVMLSDFNVEFTDTGERARRLYPMEYDLSYTAFLIKSEDEYYTISQDLQLVKTTLDNFLNDSTDLDTINDNTGILPDKFSLITDDTSMPLSIKGLKQKSFMIVTPNSTDLPNAVYFKSLDTDKALTNASAKIVVSVDDGDNYYTYKDGAFEKVDLVIPARDCVAFTEEQKTQWNVTKAKILNEGISVDDVDSIDFKQLGIVYHSMKFKYALAIEVQGIDSTSNFKKVSMTYQVAES